MGFFNNLFDSTNNTTNENKFNWLPLTETSQLREIIELSKDKLVVIFKHSRRCGISSAVLTKFEKATDSNLETIAFYYLDLIKYRDISNEIAQVFNVYHQSPQVLLIKNGETIAHHSHYDIISSFNLKDFI